MLCKVSPLRVSLLGFLVTVGCMRSTDGMRKKRSITKTLTGTEFCDEQIIKETCEDLVGKDGLVHTDTIKAVTVASGDEGQEVKKVRDEVLEKVVGSTKGGVSCAKLCEATLAFMKKTVKMPPAGDIGCVTVGRKQRCDIDLSPDAIKSWVNPKADVPHSAHHQDYKPKPDFSADKEPSPSEEKKWFTKRLSVDQEAKQLGVQLGNLFRIYPDTTGGLHFDDIQAGSTSLIEDEKEEEWMVKAATVNLKAKTYLNEAIRKFNNRATKTEFDFWFGSGTSDQEEFRERVQAVMNSVKNLLDNVEFAYDRTCASNVFAYVYPRPSSDESAKDAVKANCAGVRPEAGEACVKNNKDQFVFYLCDLYMNSEEGPQIETLLHEGSHHHSAFTTDVCMNEFYYGKPRQEYVTMPISNYREKPLGSLDWYGRDLGQLWRKFDDKAMIKLWKHDSDRCGEDQNVKGYGQGTCAALARLDPQKAVRNADNFCYYIAHTNSGESNVQTCEKSGKFCVGDRVKTDTEKGGVVQFQYFPIGTSVQVRDKDDEEWATCTIQENTLRPKALCPDYINAYNY